MYKSRDTIKNFTIKKFFSIFKKLDMGRLQESKKFICPASSSKLLSGNIFELF